MSFGSAMKNIREGNERRARRGLPLDPFWEEFVTKKDPGWKARHPYESGTKEERIARGRQIISDIENRPPEPKPEPKPDPYAKRKWIESLDANGNVMRAIHEHTYGRDVSFDAKKHEAVFECADCGDNFIVDTSG